MSQLLSILRPSASGGGPTTPETILPPQAWVDAYAAIVQAQGEGDLVITGATFVDWKLAWDLGNYFGAVNLEACTLSTSNLYDIVYKQYFEASVASWNSDLYLAGTNDPVDEATVALLFDPYLAGMHGSYNAPDSLAGCDYDGDTYLLTAPQTYTFGSGSIQWVDTQWEIYGGESGETLLAHGTEGSTYPWEETWDAVEPGASTTVTVHREVTF